MVNKDLNLGEGLHLGALLSDAGERGDALHVNPDDLTTHGVIVGMTGSGKTGLGVVLIEEALLQGIPVIAIDPKGDLGNMALTFPTLSIDEFRPWVDPSAANREGVDIDTAAEQAATQWREGLASWEMDEAAVARLRGAADVTIYTPGSTAGRRLNLVGSFAVPETSDPELRRDEASGLVTGLLTLLGGNPDPLADREHIMLSNLLEHAWSRGNDLDLPTLVSWVQQPPLRKLGVLDLDQFFPPSDRTAFATKLNGLLASPAFGEWTQGEALNIDSLLQGTDGRPRASVITLSHLSDTERQFVVSLVLGKVVTWMRSQPGTRQPSCVDLHRRGDGVRPAHRDAARKVANFDHSQTRGWDGAVHAEPCGSGLQGVVQRRYLDGWSSPDGLLRVDARVRGSVGTAATSR